VCGARATTHLLCFLFFVYRFGLVSVALGWFCVFCVCVICPGQPFLSRFPFSVVWVWFVCLFLCVRKGCVLFFFMFVYLYTPLLFVCSAHATEEQRVCVLCVCLVSFACLLACVWFLCPRQRKRKQTTTTTTKTGVTSRSLFKATGAAHPSIQIALRHHRPQRSVAVGLFVCLCVCVCVCCDWFTSFLILCVLILKDESNPPTHDPTKNKKEQRVRLSVSVCLSSSVVVALPSLSCLVVASIITAPRPFARTPFCFVSVLFCVLFCLVCLTRGLLFVLLCLSLSLCLVCFVS